MQPNILDEDPVDLVVIIYNSYWCKRNINLSFVVYRPAIHRERRKFLRSALKELALIFTDQPGLLGPKVRES